VQRWLRGSAADPIEAVHGENQSLRQIPTSWQYRSHNRFNAARWKWSTILPISKERTFKEHTSAAVFCSVLFERESCLLGFPAGVVREPTQLLVLLFGRRPDLPPQLAYSP
jgi:hypothetical protein